MIQAEKQYENQIGTLAIAREKLSKKQKYLPFIRFLSFVLCLISFYNYLIFSAVVIAIVAFIALLLFILLTLADNLLKTRIERLDRLIQICRNEIKSINGDYSPFESGDEFTDSNHSYSFDLDLFGKKSLYNCINRSVTIFGKKRLADYFENAYSFKDQIYDRQKAVTELSEKIEFRQQMQLVFFGQKSTEKDRNEFTEWLGSVNNLLHNHLFNALRFLLPVITFTLIILSIMGYVIVQFPIMMVILQLLIVSMYGRKTIKVQTLLTSKVDLIAKYAKLLLVIEKCDFKTPYLVELKNKLTHDGIETPATIIKQL